MKGFLGLLLLAAGTTIAAKPDILELWQEIYPVDAIRQAALDRCGFEDQNFNRLSAVARETCYQKMLPGAATASLQASALQAAPNALDVSRLAGAPQGDIRKQQATEQYRSALHR